MKQLVNLCVGLPKRMAVSLSAKRITHVSMIFVLLLFVLYGFSFLGELKLKKQLKILQASQTQVQAALTKIGGKFPTVMKKGEELEQQLKTLNEEAMLKTRIVSELGQQSIFNVQGFSQYLEALSKEIVPNVWLEKIDFSEGGTQISLSGKAFNSQDVLQFLKNLSQNTLFKDKQLKLTSLDQPKEKSDKDKKDAAVTQEPLTFTIQTKVTQEK